MADYKHVTIKPEVHKAVTNIVHKYQIRSVAAYIEQVLLTDKRYQMELQENNPT